MFIIYNEVSLLGESFRFSNAQVSKKNGGVETTFAGKKQSFRLFDCCLVNLNAVSCLTALIIHYHFHQQQENFSIMTI